MARDQVQLQCRKLIFFLAKTQLRFSNSWRFSVLTTVRLSDQPHFQHLALTVLGEFVEYRSAATLAQASQGVWFKVDSFTVYLQQKDKVNGRIVLIDSAVSDLGIKVNQDLSCKIQVLTPNEQLHSLPLLCPLPQRQTHLYRVLSVDLPLAIESELWALTSGLVLFLESP